MNFIVIGTAHEFQNGEPGLEGILRAFLELPYIEPLTAIAEEFDGAIGDSSLAQRLAFERHLCWCNVDMTEREKEEAGILPEQEDRRKKMVQEGIAYRVPSDDVREDAWVAKLVKPASGTTLVVCGYLHLEPLVQKLCARGHTVDKRVYLKTVPQIILVGGGTQNLGTPCPF